MSENRAVHRYMLDSNIFDKLIDEPGAFALASDCVEAGTIVLLTTHVQADEIAATPDITRRKRLLAPLSLTRQEATLGFVIGYSRIGGARLGEPEPFETLRAGEDRATRTRDALISNTAQYEGATLVTEDTDMRDRATASNIPVIDWRRLRDRFYELGEAEKGR